MVALFGGSQVESVLILGRWSVMRSRTFKIVVYLSFRDDVGRRTVGNRSIFHGKIDCNSVRSVSKILIVAMNLI